MDAIDTNLLESRRLAFSDFTRSQNTLAGYEHGWKMFTGWCVRAGRESLPASDETIALHLTQLITDGKKISTAEHRLAAIRFKHRKNELPSPDGVLARSVTGAKRVLKQQPKQKAALTVEDLKLICSTSADLPLDVRNRAILLFGFATALRRSEIARMNYSDISITDRGML